MLPVKSRGEGHSHWPSPQSKRCLIFPFVHYFSLSPLPMLEGQRFSEGCFLDRARSQGGLRQLGKRQAVGSYGLPVAAIRHAPVVLKQDCVRASRRGRDTHEGKLLWLLPRVWVPKKRARSGPRLRLKLELNHILPECNSAPEPGPVTAQAWNGYMPCKLSWSGVIRASDRKSPATHSPVHQPGPPPPAAPPL
jgi:hypothetical protein